MFEEADADVLLLYDCCHSAATTASSSYKGQNSVTEVLAACGYETLAPEVGEHSFSNALTEILAAASKGRPFSIAELHARVLNRLKCWSPSLAKDGEGKFKEDRAGRLEYERQPRRTPIYSIVCETETRRSITLAPLKSELAGPQAGAIELDGSDVPSASIPAGPITEQLSSVESSTKKRKRSLEEDIQYPQVLLAVRLDKHELNIDAWKECLLYQLPPEAKDIKIEGIFGSFSTLLLLRMPVAVWDLLSENPAYSFVGFVTSENNAIVEPKPIDFADVCHSDMSKLPQARPWSEPWDPLPLRMSMYDTTPNFSLGYNCSSPWDMVSSPAECKIMGENEDDPNEIEAWPAVDEYADSDYSPKSLRRKNRRPTRTSPSYPNNKKHMVTKSAVPSKSKFACKTCGHVSKDATTLVKHVAAAHTRPYVCTFSFAGCNSTFGNINEWKRHVYSQHLGLQYWLCNVGFCGNTKPKSRVGMSGNEFNRKDLFTQHLRRMHAPFAVKRLGRKSVEWEERVKALQASCLKIRREGPTITKCPVRACAQIFEGPTSWDDRMEHVARHLEKTSRTLPSSSLPSLPSGNEERDVVEQESDEYMIEWCLKEKIIERKNTGGYKLCLDSGSDAAEENDDASEEEE